MPNPRYISGRRLEYLLKNEYEAQGCTVIRASGSHGLFDLVVIEPTKRVWLVQVKGIKTPHGRRKLVKDFMDSALTPSTHYHQLLYIRYKGAWEIYDA